MWEAEHDVSRGKNEGLTKVYGLFPLFLPQAHFSPESDGKTTLVLASPPFQLEVMFCVCPAL